jgi:hypothetical protein
MPNPVSFTNEHSAEYLLVPDLVHRLETGFDTIIPDFVWLSRLGQRIAKQSLADGQYRLVTAYARRPKVITAGDPQVMMRVNGDLFGAAHVGERLGCPVLAGVPLVSHMLAFTLGADCAWFQLHDLGGALNAPSDVWLDVASSVSSGGYGLSAPLNSIELLRIVRSAACLDRTEIVDAIHEMRYAAAPAHASRWGGSYKPFHLLIPADA